MKWPTDNAITILTSALRNDPDRFDNSQTPPANFYIDLSGSAAERTVFHWQQVAPRETLV
jgi:hypothetical protein